MLGGIGFGASGLLLNGGSRAGRGATGKIRHPT